MNKYFDIIFSQVIIREKGETQSSNCSVGLQFKFTLSTVSEAMRSKCMDFFYEKLCSGVNLRQIQSIFSSLYKTVLISVFWLKQSYKNLRFFFTGFAFLFDLFLLTTLHFFSCQLLFDEELQRI